MSQLRPSDRRLLLAALGAGHDVERSMSMEAHEVFVASLRACANAESDLVKRLSQLAPKCQLDLGAKHLMTLLAPLERLSGRSARDEEFLFSESDGSPLSAPRLQHVVLCENLRSAFNVGAVYRTTETFGGAEVWLCGYTPEPMKTAMGTDDLVRTRRFDRASQALVEAKSMGFTIVALENSPGATPLEAFDWPEKAMIVLGNERFGVDSETLAACDHVVRISTRGSKNSLNVGIAFGIAASSWSRTHPQEIRESVAPIGFLRGGFLSPQAAPRQGAYSRAPFNAGSSTPVTGSIELSSRFEGRPSNFSQALKDLEGFERAWVLFGFHESSGWNPQVRPPRGDGTKRGLFATRSPHRPNKLGLSSVKILDVDVSHLCVHISEHDLLEGTPIYDIKPYVPGADAFPHAKAGWVDDVERSAYSVSESARARLQIDWLEANGESRLRPFIEEQLRYMPFDESRKRVELLGSGDTANLGAHHTISFRTWRVDFKIVHPRNAAGPSQIQVLNVRGGYSASELADDADPFLDKTLHRHYLTEKF